MNFKNIFKLQEQLDSQISLVHDDLHVTNLLEKKILALIVELSELANEVQDFKYWKKNKNISFSKIEEEYVDGIHFLSSLSNMSGLSEIIEPFICKENNINFQFIKTYQLIIALFDNLENKEKLKESLKLAFASFLGIAKLLNISDNEINDWYVKKNKINLDRLANNY